MQEFLADSGQQLRLCGLLCPSEHNLQENIKSGVIVADLRGEIPLSGAIFEGSASISVQTRALQRHHPYAKQINAGTTIQATLERLQPIDLPLRLTIAPGFRHGIANGPTFCRKVLAKRRIS